MSLIFFLDQRNDQQYPYLVL